MPSDRVVRRALVLRPYLRPLGGAEGVTAWIVHALASDHAVTIFCREPPDLAAIDRRYGTAICGRRVDAVIAPPLPRWLCRFSRLDNLRDWHYQRHARRLGPRFDLLVAADNEADLGRSGIQYIHHPKTVFQPRGGRDIGWYHARSTVGAAYFELSSRLTGFSYPRMLANRTLACSEWIAERVRRLHGIEPTVLYPPAAGDFPDVPWPVRQDGVVWCGRLWPDRRVEMVIDIVERVRHGGLPLHLTLLAAPHDPVYAEQIRTMVAARGEWLRLEENVDRTRLASVMSAYRYGLHGTAEEWFGMAPAELVHAGAITFVPRGGGQVEIVGGDDRLTFTTAEEGAEKIASVVRSSTLQESLRAYLAPFREKFSSERFVREFRAVCGLAAPCASV